MVSTSPKPFVFVLMPFADPFDDVYELGIKIACADAGAYCERVDEQIFHESIIERIYNQIAKSDLIVADMTGRNPNVFYEVGYAHSLGKTVILLTRNPKDIPFDLKQYPHVIYEKISELKNALTKRIRWYVENPEGSLTHVERTLEFYIGGIQLQQDKETRCVIETSDLRITVHNSTRQAYAEGSILIGIVAPLRIYYGTADKDFDKVLKMPDGSFLHFVKQMAVVFPDAWDTVYGGKISRDTSLKLRVFTEFGTRNYPITFVKKTGK